MRDVCECAQREIVTESCAELLDKGLPHQAASRVIREGEVYTLIKELLHFFLAAGLGLTCATNNRYSEVVFNELSFPLG